MSEEIKNCHSEGNEGAIIIDGVDVSGCEYAKILTENYVECDAWDDRTLFYVCEVNNNCYYKQLQCKIAECEKYKKMYSYFKDINKQLGYKLIRLKEEIKKSPLCIQCGEVGCEIRKLRRQLQIATEAIQDSILCIVNPDEIDIDILYDILNNARKEIEGVFPAEQSN